MVLTVSSISFAYEMAEIIDTPSIPISLISLICSVLIPPIATIGKSFANSFISFKPVYPIALPASSFDIVEKTGPTPI